ncbi:MAG TPA: alkaline phosphatase family protein [Longimicrobiales bacterium]|nr:alkaline phosphatase family protein [Longimicrobiales bacterium]
MRSSVVITASLALAFPFGAPSLGAQATAEGPALVVMISVDQLRADLVDRYAPAFDGGFKQLLEKGYRFTGASHAHAVTETAAGHAALSTGVFPSRSGIVSNSWAQRAGSNWASMYAVADTLSPILGVQGVEGRSPANLIRTGLADWVLAADPEARAVSLSAKDRAAITMAGRSRAEVYWLLAPLGRFVTSSYYRDKYPKWVTGFNERRMPEILGDTLWTEQVPERYRHLARADSAPYEGDGLHTTFPHAAALEADPGVQYYNSWALAQPRADRAVQLLAQEAVKELKLGQRGHVDYLGLSFSSTDYVGHAFGPFSREQFDNLMKLDRELGELFAYLDAEVGKGRWVVGLSADHGVMTMPEYLVASGEDPDASRVDAQALYGELQLALENAAAEGSTGDELAQKTASLLETRGLVAKAYTHRDLTVGMPADSFATLFRNSYYPGRAAGILSRLGIEVRFGYDNLISGAPTGTTHGSPYWYDRHVPFMLMGPGIDRGVSDDAVYSVDLAPTLAGLAGITIPDDLDGKSVYR